MLPSASSPSIVVRLYKFLNSGDCSRSHVAAYPSAAYSSNPGTGNGAPALSNTFTCKKTRRQTNCPYVIRALK